MGKLNQTGLQIPDTKVFFDGLLDTVFGFINKFIVVGSNWYYLVFGTIFFVVLGLYLWNSRNNHADNTKKLNQLLYVIGFLFVMPKILFLIMLNIGTGEGTSVQNFFTLILMLSQIVLMFFLGIFFFVRSSILSFGSKIYASQKLAEDSKKDKRTLYVLLGVMLASNILYVFGG
ncbi:MAG: hypothetical protein LBV67_09655 [Streptococcaceae bacterium]|nr:hypothetical protein [Streptococcaceae bacterium]